MSDRDVMTFDVVIVGAGPAGLATAIRLCQAETAPSVCVVEKGAEVGAHILSGAVIEPRGLDELIPDWRARGAPVEAPVEREELYLLRDARRSWRVPEALLPPSLHNAGCQLVSLGNLCRWLAAEAEALGVEIFPGFAATEVLFDAQGAVIGVATGDMGIGADGRPKDNHAPGVELHARQTVFAEGCRGHLGKQLYQRFALDAGSKPQHYGLGIKELWEIPEAQHEPGLIQHGTGWPLPEGTHGGFFLYHLSARQVAVGLIVDLDYRNPWLSPFDEFQRMKHHPLFAGTLAGGTRLAYGARALVKGGFDALPRQHFPGGCLAGCEGGTLDNAKLKGVHTALKSGMLVADEILAAFATGDPGGRDLTGLDARLHDSWLYADLRAGRNFGTALRRFGTVFGGAFNTLDQRLLGARRALRRTDDAPDHARLDLVDRCSPITYDKPDGVLSFDRLSSVYLANTAHEEDQPCHLHLADPSIPTGSNLSDYAEPAQRYCPAGVYELVGEGAALRLQINAANCVHCKTCDIKDPAANITWVAPEGGSGPNYPNM
ncbi:electron transfer flavoprotein-ubiquinone oxidoreductase [Marichromatium bheemlicum]|uniref:Electron transfer flavoprotein-ubiquinone oxidoreductase n=1 Tax=Marichromatium bheemlicum TaxID=365339 RepID=A0ABX1I4M0_9GAMM|nr:electron transfer flavoprotein-ubiquinone oxidoreductase [Marichromatium bheemlicum]NKN32497.1 electron transfer flavoprotein-ubiquinone oxidoreductase [Marichromatium bheemlicum]